MIVAIFFSIKFIEVKSVYVVIYITQLLMHVTFSPLPKIGFISFSRYLYGEVPF